MTMLLSAGMPTFYLTSFLEMLFMYWTDKYLCKSWMALMIYSLARLQKAASVWH